MPIVTYTIRRIDSAVTPYEVEFSGRVNCVNHYRSLAAAQADIAFYGAVEA